MPRHASLVVVGLLILQYRGTQLSGRPAKLGTAYRNWPRQYGGAPSRAQHRDAVLGYGGVCAL
jgi:hypothetical protein